MNAPGSTLKFSPSPLNFGNVYVGTTEIDYHHGDEYGHVHGHFFEF